MGKKYISILYTKLSIVGLSMERAHTCTEEKKEVGERIKEKREKEGEEGERGKGRTNFLLLKKGGRACLP